MPDYITNPTNQQIKEIGRNIESLFDPRRAAQAQEAGARRALIDQNTALSKQRTASETEKTRGMKGANDAIDQTDVLVQKLSQENGWDPNLAPLFSNFVKQTRGKNLQQVMEGARTFVGLSELFKKDPEAARRADISLRVLPNANTAHTPEQGAEIRKQKTQGDIDLQKERNVGSAANTAATVAGAKDRQQMRINAKPGGANPAIAEKVRQIKALETQINAAATAWRASKGAQAKAGTYGDPNKEKPGGLESNIEAMRAQHDQLVREVEAMQAQPAQPALPSGAGQGMQGADALFGNAPAQTPQILPQAAPTVPVAPAAPAAPVVPGRGFGFGANAAAPSAPMQPPPQVSAPTRPPIDASNPEVQADLKLAQQLIQSGKDPAWVQQKFEEKWGPIGQ